VACSGRVSGRELFAIGAVSKRALSGEWTGGDAQFGFAHECRCTEKTGAADYMAYQ